MSKPEITLIEQTGLDQHIAPFPKPHMEGFENPERLKMALQYLRENDALKDILTYKTPKADRDEALLAHSPYLVHSVEIMSDLGSGELGESAYASENLLTSALYALGGALFASDLTLLDSTKHSFALIRPPGHHASTSMSMGLCFFNNVAIATKSMLIDPSVSRVTILDIDDHYGNGTAEIFYNDPYVQFISLHQYDHISFGLGHYKEMGLDDAEGTNLNIPLHEGSSDSSYQDAFDKIVRPAIEAFSPDAIAISAGYDAHYSDPIGEMDLDSRTYWYIAKMIDSLVDQLSMQGSFWVLEGGYNPLALGPCIRATLEGLQGNPQPELEDQESRPEDEDAVKKNKRLIKNIVQTFSNYL